MSEDEQRFAIAEACGFVWYRIPNPRKDGREHRMLAHPAIHEYETQSDCWKVRADGTERVCNLKFMESNGYLPDYLHDLNAMHEVENTFADRLQNDHLYEYWLSMIQKATHLNESWCFVHATAAQRAEAFLRTIGKWQ